LFIVHGGPFSFSELAERLKVSRGSISTNARILRQLGFIERIGLPGDRQDYYRLSDEPYARLLEGYVARLRERLSLVEELRAALAGSQAEAQQRLARMQGFYTATLAATEALINRVRGGNGQG
ncbi:MAG: MarR family transcriptional regulator, partial [Chromatiaceae bacterium]|nr:MarR family transcriptional regulator [Chromatiaceae bacterium]